MQTDSYRRRNAVYEALVADIAARAGKSPLSAADCAALTDACEAERGALLALCAQPAETLGEARSRAVILAELLEVEHWTEHHAALARRISDDLALLSSANVTPLKRSRNAA